MTPDQVHKLTQELHRRVSAVCPGASVRIGDALDRSTWVAVMPDGASDADRALAATAISSFDIVALSVPTSVRMWQAKAALAGAGKLESANTIIAKANNPALSIAWEYATDVSRDSPGLNSVAVALGMTSADVDALFIAAEAIQV